MWVNCKNIEEEQVMYWVEKSVPSFSTKSLSTSFKHQTPNSPELMNHIRVQTFPTVYFPALSPISTHKTLISLKSTHRLSPNLSNPRTQLSWNKTLEQAKTRRKFEIRNSTNDNGKTGKWLKWVPRGDIAERILRLISGATSSPICQYVSSPTTFLHSVDPRIKLVWLLALVVLPSRSHIIMRFGLVTYLALLSIWVLPRQVWMDQLGRVGLLSGILFIMLGLGSDGAPPLVQLRTPPPTMTGLSNLPTALGGYSYLVMKLGPLQLTRKGLAVASTSACLTFTIFQSASLCLATTTPEQLAAALRWFMLPLTLVGVPVAEVVLTLLLSLRFISLVFDEVRNAALGIVARRINWKQLTIMETVDIFFMYVRRIFKNIFSHAEHITQCPIFHEGCSIDRSAPNHLPVVEIQAMIVRGFRGDGNTHKIYVLSNSSIGIADVVSLLCLGGVIGAAVLSECYLI
ncbi:ABC/ECF transporter [Macleaya cordata]|uniref:ABC/ECF transporter n=1 Tax=Macleaya cordata TaxID=56857 RepID=A0A200RBJ8_MACCD|nr:ABC/ECF transporter [Macleaya cordata]